MDELNLLAFLVGPLGGVVLGPVSLIVMLASARMYRSRWPVWTGVALFAVLMTTILAYWQVFGANFELAAGEAQVPASRALLETVTMAIAAGASCALMVSAIAAGRRPRRSRPVP